MRSHEKYWAIFENIVPCKKCIAYINEVKLHMQFYAYSWIHLKCLFNTGLVKQNISDRQWKVEIEKKKRKKKAQVRKRRICPSFHCLWVTIAQQVWYATYSWHICTWYQQVTKSTKSVGTKRVQTHRPLSRPTPQTLMLTMGCEWRTVRSMGSIRFSMSFSNIRYMSLPCNSTKYTVTEHVLLSNWLVLRSYAYIVKPCIL